ncbi:hypothetical protein Tco_0908694 [Tanacetum coccineum]|uniref:Xylulose kinase-1 n=1 Tax=Tanacetum coccineum TaxID=301880 RepID=A0ABQ5CUE1_9ASTR
MAALKFADTHNMVAFLEKPTKSVGFEEIVDFLNAHSIRYALTINPTIYVSCIEQFWSTAKTKTINKETQIHALVDGKKIVITKSSVRRDFQLADEEASAIICLATNQTFNFSKMIFDGMIRNLDNASSKFLMYPRFVQLFLEKPIDNHSVHKRKYIASFHTKKIFANMKRIGKEFSGNVTPLFPSMVVQNQSQMGEGSAIPTDPQHTPTFIPSTSQPQKTQKPRKHKRQDTKIPQFSGPTEHVADEVVYKERDDRLVRAATTASSLEAEQDNGNITKTQSKATPNEPGSQGTSSGGSPRRQETMGDTISQTWFENVSKTSNDSLLVGVNTLRSDEDSLKLKELMELCTNLQNRVIDLEKTKTSQAQEITSLKRRVKRLEKKGGSRTHKLKRLYKIGSKARVASSGEESLGEEDASKQGRKIDDIDADEGVTLVDETAENQGRFNDEEMFDAGVLDGEEVFANAEQEVVAVKEVHVEEVKKVVSTAEVTTAGIEVTTASATTTTADDLTLA